MAYQDPAFMVAHLAADLPLPKFQPVNADTFTDDSKRALIDSRQGELASFTATGVDAGFLLTFVGVNAAPRINRAVIPAGHTFDGFQLKIQSDDDTPGFPSLVTQFDQTITGGGVIDAGFSLVTDHVDWRIRLPGSTAEVFSLAEFWLGERKTLTVNDGRVSQGFERAFEHDVSESEFGGRTASLEFAPARRKFSLRIRDLDPTAADFATLDEVIRNGRARPFWYWTPDDTDTGPYLVKLTRLAARRQTSDIPKTFMRYEVELEMLEQIT